MSVKITSVESGSLGSKKRIKKGDTLLSVNGHEIFDVLDYRFYGNSDEVYIKIINSRGKIKEKHIRHVDGVDSLGLSFDTYLMDKKQSCKNKCIFCFVDQMPKGMRESLYFKDDDSRLSFFFGNYITLTAISEREVQRIIDMHISPINISVHTMDPQLRVRMMKNPHAGEALKIIDRLSDADIPMNTQLVLCPGINDGEALRFSLDELSKRYPAVQSIAAVPVGLTSHRDGLFPLVPYNKKSAGETLDIIEEFNQHFMFFHGFRLCYPADEFYLIAEREMPNDDFYGDFSQLENGVGMWALLRATFLQALDSLPADINLSDKMNVIIATGCAAFPLICFLVESLRKKVHGVNIFVYKIINNFFGESVTVAGLITGRDLIEQLADKNIGGSTLILTSSMMKGVNEQIFLDDITVKEVEERLNVDVIISPETDGEKLLYNILGM